VQRNELTWDGPRAERKLRAAAVAGLGQWSELVLQQARAEVPLDEATLERSGVTSVDPEELAAAVSFDTPYAVVQHEDMTFEHAPGRKAKYLEDPWNRSADTAADLLAAHFRRALR
jgi:hypothetical protein